MKGITVTVLLVLAGLAAWGAHRVTSSEAPPSDAAIAGNVFLPGLQASINDIARVRISGSQEESVTLEKNDTGWTVQEKSSYPADSGNIRKTLLALAGASIIEGKTANPDYYQQLGVSDPAAEGATGVQLELEGLAEPLRIILGKREYQPRDSTFVRRPDEKQSWLVSGAIGADKDPLQWIDREVMDIGSDRVQSIRIQHADGEVLQLRKETRAQDNFEVVDVPAERELSSESAANPLAAVLASLRLSDVSPLPELNPKDHSPVIGEYRAFDGVVISAQVFEAEKTRYAHFEARFDEEQAKRFAVEGEDESARESARKEAEALQAKLSGWVYAVPGSAYKDMTKRIGDLLAPEQKDDAPSEDKAAEEKVEN